MAEQSLYLLLYMERKLVNWYKISILINNLSDRTALNERIRTFKELASVVKYLSKYVVQNARDAKRAAKALALDKRISSYPEIKDLFLTADRVALDNYKTFTDICLQILAKISGIVSKMERERKEFSDTTYPKTIRERIQNAETDSITNS